MGKFFLIVIFCLGGLLAKDSNTTHDQAYINILSNIPNTPIYLNKELIGNTPIKNHKVIPKKSYTLEAKADKKFYPEDILRTFTVEKNTLTTHALDFKKGVGEVFLVGEDGDLYIDGRFIQTLHDNNRVLKIETGKNREFTIRNQYKQATVYKDISLDSFNEIKYTLINIPLDIRLYTQIIDNLMWEDTKEAANSAVDFQAAQKYCENLRIGEFTDWQLPTISQLEDLHKNNKEEIYNGFGGIFYWSSQTKSGKKNIWQYATVLKNEYNEIEQSIQEFKDGRVRCVRVLYENIPTQNNQTKELNTTTQDQNITQNLERFLLK